jgi:hypothetical protein
MSTDYRALCAELLAIIPASGTGNPHSLVVARARALLAQPVAEGPTDDEIYKLALEGDFLVDVGDGFSCMVQDEIEFARAILAKWGNSQGILDSSPQPPADGDVGEYREDWDMSSDEGSECFASAIISRLWGYEEVEADLRQWLADYLKANALPTPDARAALARWGTPAIAAELETQ